MAIDQPPRRSQTVDVKPKDSYGWTEMLVHSKDTCDELASITRIKSREGAAFVDLSIEEYTGLSRRAKYTSVRLDKEAARELHAILSAKFANPAHAPD